ncbi:MAG: mercuric reductase [Acidobacteriota bacterium]
MADSRGSEVRMEPWDDHNRRLIASVHPPDWVNPEPAERYHLVVIGAGTGGLVTAAIAVSLGAKVALVERHLMGGDCLNVGCVPSKGIISAARAWRTARDAHRDLGAPKGEGPGDFALAMERMRSLRADIGPVDGAERFRDLGVDVFLGEGRFVAGDVVEVGDRRLRFRRAVIATGARASAPPIPGLDTVRYRTNEDLFELTELPRRFGVIGAGPIGCEMAQSFARFGSEVVLFDMADQVLPREDDDAAKVVQGALEKDGVDLRLGVKIEGLRPAGDGQEVAFSKDGKRDRVVVDELLVAVGRAPNVEGLGLEAAGVAYDRKGIQVDGRLRTTHRKIFAVGDVASKYQFTHTADAQARMVVRNAFFFGRGRSSDLVIPWCTYTSPEVAHVGLHPSEAEGLGLRVETMTVPMEDVDRARLDGEDEGFLRVHLEAGSDKILGATLVAEHAGDMIGHLSFAMTHGLGLSKFSSTIFPYPTQGEVFRKAGDQWNRRRLTPFAQRFFELWFRIFG